MYPPNSVGVYIFERHISYKADIQKTKTGKSASQFFIKMKLMKVQLYSFMEHVNVQLILDISFLHCISAKRLFVVLYLYRYCL